LPRAAFEFLGELVLKSDVGEGELDQISVRLDARSSLRLFDESRANPAADPAALLV
jgi:hypothetical protein